MAQTLLAYMGRAYIEFVLAAIGVVLISILTIKPPDVVTLVTVTAPVILIPIILFIQNSWEIISKIKLKILEIN
jgi:hypothetical protein